MIHFKVALTGTTYPFVLKYFYNYLHEADNFNSIPIDLAALGVPGFDPLILPIDKSYTSERHNLEYTHFTNPIDALNITFGVSAQHDRIKSNYRLNPDRKERLSTYRLFGSLIWDIDNQSTIDLGFLAEKSDSADTDVSSRVAYLHHLDNNHTFRVG